MRPPGLLRKYYQDEICCTKESQLENGKQNNSSEKNSQHNYRYILTCVKESYLHMGAICKFSRERKTDFLNCIERGAFG